MTKDYYSTGEAVTVEVSSDNRRGLYYKGGDYYSKGGASEIEKDSCCGEGTMTMRITPGKVCKHLDSRVQEVSPWRGADTSIKTWGWMKVPDSTWIRGPIRAVAAVREEVHR